MYVKLVNPANTATQMLKVPCGDVHYELKGEFDQEMIEIHEQGIVDAGWEHRHFIAWPDSKARTKVPLTQITIPGVKANQTQVVLTNWDAYLVHDSGRTVDRIHRHRPKEEVAPA